MPNRRKRIHIVSALLVVAIGLVVLVVILRPRNEPKYQDRYLSEWATRKVISGEDTKSVAEAKRALEAIGTNGLPHYLEWLPHEPSNWRRKLWSKLPQSAKDNPMISNWLDDPAFWRSQLGYVGIEVLGTNAADAVPELSVMMTDVTKPRTAQVAILALGLIGEEAIPALQAALSDKNYTYRSRIIVTICDMARNGHYDTCFPILLEALNDRDLKVRMEATNGVNQLAPHLLINAPAN